LQLAELGGGTRFPKASVEMFPTRGGAVFFTDLQPSGTPDPTSLHAGTPVERGLKIVARYWQRQRVFESHTPT
ncbi:hypothetical protein RZS08_37960, partial [Arthrospira platensis SPKY1]|nr:hypothetical protein [Arthrospira platensis SPKY1]